LGSKVMKETTILLIAFTLGFLTASLVGIQTVQTQHTSDGRAFILVSPIDISSPANTTYTPQTLILNFSVRTSLTPDASNITIVYSIDGKTNTTIRTESTPVPIKAEITYPNGTTTTGISIQSYYLITGWVALSEIPEGSHNITVYGRYEFPGSYHNFGLDNRAVYFTVNDGNPPIISNLSLENKTYSKNDLSLNFTTGESTSWVGYSLDGKENVTIAGNTTLAALADGPHRLTVYANDTVGNMGASQTINFNVSLLPSLNLSYAIVGTAVVITAVAGILLLRIKARKEKSGLTQRFNI
jgi:hypothetical protein